MANEEKKSTGLLSKMARFVRHPTVNWSDLDRESQEGEESQYSKQALKDMMERKRQNDFVRKREFDQLRKQRLAQLAKTAAPPSGSVPIEATGAPAASSFLQSAQSSHPDERADTIKKIDEIEAQMAQQWWRGKQVSDAATMPMPMPEGGNVMPSTFNAPPPAAELPVLSDVLPDGPGTEQAMSGAGALEDEGFSQEFTQEPASASSSSGILAASFAPFEHDAALEEAAIVFANGDAQAAKDSLLALIEQRSGNIAMQLPIWLALLDLYRAAGWQTQFEDAAMDFVGRFGRSAPQWFVMPQHAGQLSDASSSEPQALIGFRWQAPVQLGESSLRALVASKARVPGPWTMDWSALQILEADVRQPLMAAVTEWTEEKGELIFAGVDQLQEVLAKQCPSGDRNIDQDWWHLRLAMQRLMHSQDDFELAALDYCVTYELSPPSWVEPVSSYAQEGSEQEELLTVNSRLQGPDSIPPSVLWRERAPKFALQGIIDGDALPWLNEVQSKAKPGETIAIDCTQLVRMDFAAAGSVLNWTSEMQSLGHILQFSQLHQLVAVFFNVVGIQEHARVLPRRD